MKATNLVILASIIAVTGRWARGKGVDTQLVVGGIFLAVSITVMEEVNADLATKFAWLILAAIVGVNAETLLKTIGATTTNTSVGANVGSAITGGK